ncbi:MAG: hypothetical protein J6V09_05465 [Clostridia bacterium]|nr:hypothetical protein [Clostridia bacterium]
MKLTRKSYKRKIIAFGIAAFISLSLTATGFASWVLASTAKKSDEGQISVGTTSEKAIEIKDLVFEDDMKNFVFEPVKDDYEGRVRYDGEKAENLSVTFTCTITAASFVKGINVTFAMPKGISDAVDAGYIVAPVVDISINSTTTDAMQTADLLLSNGQTGGGSWTYTPGAADTATLTVTLNFAWGEQFEGKNPSEYFDTPEGRIAHSHEEVKTILDTFKATVHEKSYDEYSQLSDSEKEALEAPKYTVNITAET